MKCWAIEEGAYSDRHVVAVYTSEEGAMAATSAYNAGVPDYDHAEVVEYDLDPVLEPAVVYHRLAGVTVTSEVLDERSHTSAAWSPQSINAHTWVGHERVVVDVSGSDSEHVDKAFTERLMRAKAEAPVLIRAEAVTRARMAEEAAKHDRARAEAFQRLPHLEPDDVDRVYQYAGAELVVAGLLTLAGRHTRSGDLDEFLPSNLA